MPLREYLCSYCGHLFEEFVTNSSPEDYAQAECRCGSRAAYLPSIPAPAQGNFGTSRRNPGKPSYKRKLNENADEPDAKQRELDFGAAD